jgi:trans-AT polyketide synthase, acyltransferase and oxidoreductase domains
MRTIMFPGQGSQYKGMGKELFKIFKNETIKASAILGYDLEELCVQDPEKRLGNTAFTQPALYVVNSFGYLARENKAGADYLIGHSLGEYNALFAAGVFDFETGLKMVQKRGQLMAAASGGGMAAVIGPDKDALLKLLEELGCIEVDVANFNTPTQTVIAGPKDAMNKVVKDLEMRNIKAIPLYVSAPFHSRYMKPAGQEFSRFLQQFTFADPKIPVISNVTAQTYGMGEVASLLSRQITGAVRWVDSVSYLKNKGVISFEEIGGVILTKMVNEIPASNPSIDTGKKEVSTQQDKATVPVLTKSPTVDSTVSEGNQHLAMRLGSAGFRKDYGVKYAYMAGAMYKGIASKELVVAMAKAGMLAFLGTAGLPLSEIESNISYIQQKLTNGEPYGMNLLHHLGDPAFEMKTVELYLRYGIKKIEAAAYMQMTLSLVYYRLKGIKKGDDGSIITDNHIVAKVSRPEVADAFMRPAPEKMVNQLLDTGLITQEQALYSKSVPMSNDICVEADSGGHTDGGVALVLLPSIQSLKTAIEKEYNYKHGIRVGLAGGLGTPNAVACAFIMGADFVVTGSINQCTVEAGASNSVKDLLQEINVQDTEYAPAGDMFEIGAKVQVLKRGVLFPARGNKLYALYNQYNSLDEIPVKTIEQLEKNYFKRTIKAVWEETKAYKLSKGADAEIVKAEQNPKHKMALVFRWYFGYSNKLAFDGNLADKVNFQVHTGPALGAFNQWVKGTPLESWQNRYVSKIGIMIMEGAANVLSQKLTLINKI